MRRRPFLHRRIDAIEESVSQIGGGGGAGIADAPSDGNPYVRRNNAWEESPRFLTYVKPSDEERVNDVGYTVDGHLVSETLVANAIYRFELMLLFTAGSVEDMRFRIERSGLSDAVLRYASDLDNAAAAAITWNGVVNCAGSGVTNYRMGNYIGVLITGTDTGSVRVSWGQQVSGANISTMRAGSTMMLRRIQLL